MTTARLSEAATARRNQALIALHTIGLDISARLEMREVLRLIMNHAVELLDADGGGVTLYRPETGLLEVVEAVGIGERYLGIGMKPGEGLAGRVYSSGKGMAVNDYQRWEGRTGIFADPPEIALLTVPLRWRDEVLGVLELVTDNTRRTYDDDDMWLAELFAAQAAIAIGNARLYESERRERARAAGLLEAARPLTSSLSLPDVLDNILTQAARLLDAGDGGSLHLYNTATDSLELVAATGMVARYKGRALKPGEGLAGRIFSTGQPLAVENYKEWEGRSPVYADSEVTADMGVPLRWQGEVIGVLDVAADWRTRVFGPDDITLAELFAAQAAIAIGNARLYESERRERARTAGLLEAARALTASLEMPAVLNSILEHAARLLDADQGAGVQLYSPATDTLTMTAATGLMADYIGKTLRAGEGLGGRVFKTGQAMFVENYQTWEGRVPQYTGGHIGANMCVPLRWQDEIIGVLDVAADHTRRQFTADDVVQAELLAAQAAAAIGNARLFNAERRARARADALLETTRSLTASLNLPDVLKNILRSYALALPYATGSVTIFRDGVPTLAALVGYEGREEIVVEPITGVIRRSPLLARMLETLEPIVIPDVRADPEWEVLPETGHIRNWMGIPLVAQGRLIGVLSLDGAEVGMLNEDHLEIARGLASQAAIAIQNALLYEESRQTQERFHDMALSTSDWLWETDARGRFIYFSERVTDALGYAAGEGIGRTPLHFLPREDARRFQAMAREAAARKVPVVDVEQMVRHKDGRLIPHVFSGLPVLDREGNVIGYRGSARDISASKEAERRERLAYQLGQRLSAVLSPDELMDVIVAQLREMFGYYHVTLWLYDEQARAVVVGRGTGAVDAELMKQGERITLDARPSLVARAARTLETVVSNDVENDPDYLYEPAIPRTRAEVCLPLARAGRLLGVLDVQSTKTDCFSPAEARTLELLAGQAAIALENARLYQDLEAQAQNLEALVAERTAEIIRERERLTAIVEHAGEGIAVTGPDGLIEYINPAWTRITGYASPDILGRTMGDFLIGQTPDSPRMPERIPGTSDAWEGEVHARRPDGTEYDAALTIAPALDAGGAVANLVGVLRDITSQKQVEQMRGKFVANVSHELRTPITSLKLYHTLLKTGSEVYRAEYLQTMGEQISRLERLVEDLLDLSRLDRGITTFRPEYLDLNDLVAQARREHQPRMRQHRLKFKVELSPDLPPVYIDRERMMQVITNLLNNAINYTPPQGEVAIYTRPDAEDPRLPVALVVQDSGPGIDPAELPFIFDRFYRAEAVKESGIPGTGLGLSIVKEIIQMHHARIRVESIPGAGTTFIVSLPQSKETGAKRPRRRKRKQSKS